MEATTVRVVRRLGASASASNVNRRVAGGRPDRRVSHRRPAPAAPARRAAIQRTSTTLATHIMFTLRTSTPDIAGGPALEPIRRFGVRRARDVPLEGAAARPTGPGPPAAEPSARSRKTRFSGGTERRIQ